MAQRSKPIRIAILLEGREFACPPVALPFSLEGYPPLELEVVPLEARAALQPGKYDLILDGQFLTQGLPNFSPEKLANLIAGPAALFLESLVCRLQELGQKQEINTGVINSATDAIITINEDHLIVGYNRGAEQILGYSREEALGQDLKLIIPPPYREVHRDYVRRFIATREARVIGKHVRLTAQRRDGTEFPMSISFSVAEIQGNLYFTGIIRDITDYREMEEKLLKSERLAAVGETVTRITHEIKNPLLIIGGFARQLRKVPGLDAKSQQKLSIIAEEVGRLETLMAEMRDFVRPPVAKKSLGQIEPVLDEVLELFADTLKEHHIEVQRIIEGPLPPTSFDPQQIHQVLVNLLKNALEAMPRGGTLTITSRVEGPNLEISVTDTGEGMSPEVANKNLPALLHHQGKGHRPGPGHLPVHRPGAARRLP